MLWALRATMSEVSNWFSYDGFILIHAFIGAPRLKKTKARGKVTMMGKW